MTRDEIVAYRPGQDPEFDPSAGQAAPAAPAVPKRQVMSTTDIAAYRPGEDPAYDPVERRGWWDVNIAQGTYLTQIFGKQFITPAIEHWPALCVIPLKVNVLVTAV